MNDAVATTLVGILGITGSLLMLFSAIAMFRVRDALSRINVFSPATGLGMPLIVAAAYVYDLHSEGFSWGSLLMALIAVLCLIIVSSVASNTLSRASVLSGQPVYRKTAPNRLARPPAGIVDDDPDYPDHPRAGA
ncbi:cation:proton antiporter [Brevibacterium aurantiacum]|uniref:Cation:proton antiporter n=2 Tax=Brevibacterium aurantiacum TaxID=273384 RepID=A0A2A3ZQI1_BREAU|nr:MULTISPECIES: monovalent cation/H(+) antiporter subunit G [Brevibacterium]AZL12950.1 cation:proton antiporter [Brevibacterium aurantiacum]AZT93423.1 cation:proton antiporter [Brevibacterium aurantiacum]AZT97219.1 cation:proton antiporter [Brevibacterium aurantiacum]MDN5737083.1 monovalent cation/H(+) antiporter subunit G [Brevibacterium aurantiacum]MDN5774960.1 monovalent cation/H(+) antiporter subunit G [Brevibacterium aurantiacum]